MKKILFIIIGILGTVSFLPIALAFTPKFQYDPLGTLTSGLVSYYNMQGNSNDYFGSNNGTDTSVTYGTAYGKVNEGGNYNGSTSYSSMGNVMAFEYTQPFSIAAWVYNNSSGASNIISKQQNTSPYAGYGIGTTSGGTLQFFLYNGSGFVDNFPSSYIGTWTFIVATYDGSNTDAGITLYVNGASVAKSNQLNVPFTSTIVSTNPFQLSGRGGSNNLYNGYLDEIGVWNRVLTSGEISELYHSGLGQTMCNGTGGPLCFHKVILISFNFKPEPIV